MRSSFRGDQKRTDSLLSTYDRQFANWAARRMPAWVQSHHLTLMTLGWSALVLVTARLAQHNTAWLWASSAVIGAQYFTDAIDGKLGQLRGAGLVQWGFYMDHLLDYVLLCSIVLGYALLVPPGFQWLMGATLAVAGCFMVSSFLACSLTGHLTISFLRLGPVEVRLVLILLNAWLALGGRAALVFAIPLLLVGSLTVLVVMTYHIQKRLWTLDSATRRESTREIKASAHSQPNKRMQPAGPTPGAIRSPGPAAHS
jgi:archaetidylinositol phosphate synthase